ncbi:MAG: histidinol dehydrogenase [Chloroflexi bacterium]|nr:histidinol dehydrogenase [Chloroflexota bacterium]
MRIARGVDDARRTVLRRAPLEEAELPSAAREVIRRTFGAELGVTEVVDRILHEVREQGDAAVNRYNQEIDGVAADPARSLEVTAREIEAAYEQLDADLVGALREAAERIRRFHKRQLEHTLSGFRKDGVGQQVRPLTRVGMYVPGTTAVYPSTVLMIAIPAKTAGVGELVMATPSLPDGGVSPLKLAAAHIAGVDRVFRAGGVQGIAALAYGTESIPRVDKICGPGNVFVTEAKKKLYGTVGLDGVFGPSETLVIADGAADPEMVAADLLAGAEHDELATAILISISEELATRARDELQSQMGGLERGDVARASLEARGGVAVVDTLDQALELANEFAPEHLCLHVDQPERLLDRVRNAGAVFVGAASAESIGDFTAGPSHVMPTGGSARFASPLGVQDFLKVTSVIALDEKALAKLGPAAVVMARAEGFGGHARAVQRRLERRR